MRKLKARNIWLEYDTNFSVDLTSKLKDLYDGTVSSLAVSDIDATAAEINAVADPSAQAALMSAGAGITGATGAVYKSAVIPQGDFILTKIYVDLTGTSSVATDLDVIGEDLATDLPAYIAQITAAVNGTIVGGQMTCLEVPAGGADDIDLYYADDDDKVFDNPTSGFTNGGALITAGGAWTLMLTKKFGAYPAANKYLYLVSGEAVAGKYTAGRFLMELWGI